MLSRFHRPTVFVSVSVCFALFLAVSPVAGLEPRLLKETDGAQSVAAPCVLAGNTNGTVGNFRWYNLCSGYIWIFSGWQAGEGVGVLFGGPEQPFIDYLNDVKRTITYYRNVVPFYNQTVDVFLDGDTQGDGCPDETFASDLDIDPGLRWNCTEFGVGLPIPFPYEYVIVRQVHDGGASPTFATDGPFSTSCDPNGAPRSFYYGVNGSGCVPWTGPTSRADNFLTWLIIDLGDPTATASKTWGQVKGLFR